MTFTETREKLAAAVSTVSGVTGYEFRPRVLKAGAAWPLLRDFDHGPGDAFSGTWRVIVCLGGDERDAQTKLDDLLPALVAVIDPVAYVDGGNPLTFSSEAGDLFAIEIICRSE